MHYKKKESELNHPHFVAVRLSDMELHLLLQQDLADKLAKEGVTIPTKLYLTGKEILLNQALPYFTRCVESLVLLICMKHILE